MKKNIEKAKEHKALLTIASHFFQFAISFAVAFCVNYLVTSEIVVRFIPSSKYYEIIAVAILFIQFLIVFVLLKLIIYRKIPKILYYLLIATYFCILVALLFGRPSLNRVFSFNVLELFYINSKEALIQNIFNFIFFIPIGYFFRRQTIKSTFIISLSSIIIVELIQVATKRGFFDVNDIILNTLGILIGYIISKKMKLEIVA